MMKNKLKLSLVAAMMLGTYAVADSKVTVSGEAEITYKSVENATSNTFNETEVSVGIEAENKSGIKFISSFTAYDDEQADSTASTNVTTTTAYVTAPLPSGFGLTAGLSPNNAFGTDAFENGGESWKTVVSKELSKDLKVKVYSKVINESGLDKDEGDSGEMGLAVSGKASGFKFGVKTASIEKNKDTNTEMTSTKLNAFVSGDVSGYSVAAEYLSEGDDKDGTGMFLSVGKEAGKLSTSLAYILVSGADGSGGGDFAPGSFFDGNINSNANDDTSAIVLGGEYAVSDALKASATLISASVTGDSATEVIVGASYDLDGATSVGVSYATASGDALTDDETTMSLTLATSF